MRSISRLIRDERGASAVEYGLIASLIVIAMIAGLTRLAESTTNNWNTVENKVSKS